MLKAISSNLDILFTDAFNVNFSQRFRKDLLKNAKIAT